MLRMFLVIMQILHGLQREIGGRLWLLLLSFYSIYYAAYLYLVYKILQSLPGGYCVASLGPDTEPAISSVAPSILAQYAAGIQKQRCGRLYRLWKVVPKQYVALGSLPFKVCFRQIDTERLHVSVLNEQQVRTY